MSAQFGRWSFSGESWAAGHLEQASQLLGPYGPDGRAVWSGPGVDIIYRAFHSTKESRLERQPVQLPSGGIFTWDGRLDNREELVRQLGPDVGLESSDAEIAAAAYERLRTKAFAKLVGDWALSVWEPKDRALLLAKDFLGTRHLYYTRDDKQVLWSSILDPIVLLPSPALRLDEEYFAGWLSSFPASHRTPYAGIHAVPPSTFVSIGPDRQKATVYWEFDGHKPVRHRSDRDYEEEFRRLFRESVKRRLRSDSPVLAELSGGMDSSSIVCVADLVISGEVFGTKKLETVSYYSDSEPNWNERPYFTKVEQHRGCTGCHIDLGPAAISLEPDNRFAATPAHIFPRPTEAKRQFSDYVISRRIRTLLSGIGGDEVTGGVPTPLPELEDLLARPHIQHIAQRLKAWALVKRTPWFHLLRDAARAFFPPSFASLPKHQLPPPWLPPDFVRRQHKALAGYPSRLRLLGPLPSFQENLLTLEALRRQFSVSVAPSNPAYEMRYPYLDRDLLEFLYAIPREQLVRPTERRSLMRRAMAGIVPAEVLHRRRKAFVTRAPLTQIQAQMTSLIERSSVFLSDELGLVDATAFCKHVEMARSGQDVAVVKLLRTLAIELWLRDFDSRGLLDELALARSRRLGSSA